MVLPSNRVLIVAPATYRDYDPTGLHDLPSVQHDARTWVRYLLSTGFSPDFMRVLSTPAIDLSACGAHADRITVRSATAIEIHAAFAWLMEELNSHPEASALFVYAGHGDSEDGDLLLCPSDMGPHLEGAMDVWRTPEFDGQSHALARVTALLDCCYAQVGPSRDDALRTRLRSMRDPRVPLRAVHARVVSACRAYQASATARFSDGARMGAFAWAATSTLAQWRMVRDGQGLRSTLAYGEFVSRTRSLLAALSFQQEPVLSGPPATRELAVLQASASEIPGATSATPTAHRGHRQLDGGQYAGTFHHYRLRWSNNKTSQVLAHVLATGAPAENAPLLAKKLMQGNTEYWLFDPNAVTALQAAYPRVQSEGPVVLHTDVVQKNEPSFDPPTAFSAQFTAAEGTVTDWQVYEQQSWPEGSLQFSSRASEANVRGIAIVCDPQGAVTHVWWAVQQQRMIEPHDLADQSWTTDASTKGTQYFEASVLTAST